MSAHAPEAKAVEPVAPTTEGTTEEGAKAEVNPVAGTEDSVPPPQVPPAAAGTLGAASMTEAKAESSSDAAAANLVEPGSEAAKAPITEGTLGAAAAATPEPAPPLVAAPDIDDLIADASELLKQLQKIKTNKNAQAASVEPANVESKSSNSVETLVAATPPNPATPLTLTEPVAPVPPASGPAEPNSTAQVVAASKPAQVAASNSAAVTPNPAAAPNSPGPGAHVGGKHRTKTSKRRH